MSQVYSTMKVLLSLLLSWWLIDAVAFGSNCAIRAAMRARERQEGLEREGRRRKEGKVQKPSGVIVSKNPRAVSGKMERALPPGAAPPGIFKARVDEAESVPRADTVVKVVVCGSQGCGKTSFINQLAPDPEPITELTRDWCRRTPLRLKMVTQERGKHKRAQVIEFRFFELCGRLKCPFTRAALTSDANAAVVMYDTASLKSYEEALYSLEAFVKYINAEMPCLLVGNKTDKLSNGAVIKFAAEHRRKHDENVPELLVSIKTRLEDAPRLARIIVRQMFGDKEVNDYFLNKQQLAERGRYNIDEGYLHAERDDESLDPIAHRFAIDVQTLLGNDWNAFGSGLAAAITQFTSPKRLSQSAVKSTLPGDNVPVRKQKPQKPQKQVDELVDESISSKRRPDQSARFSMSQEADSAYNGAPFSIPQKADSVSSIVTAKSESSSPSNELLRRESSSGSEGASSKSDGLSSPPAPKTSEDERSSSKFPSQKEAFSANEAEIREQSSISSPEPALESPVSGKRLRKKKPSRAKKPKNERMLTLQLLDPVRK